MSRFDFAPAHRIEVFQSDNDETRLCKNRRDSRRGKLFAAHLPLGTCYHMPHRPTVGHEAVGTEDLSVSSLKSAFYSRILESRILESLFPTLEMLEVDRTRKRAHRSKNEYSTLQEKSRANETHAARAHGRY